MMKIQVHCISLIICLSYLGLSVLVDFTWHIVFPMKTRRDSRFISGWIKSQKLFLHILTIWHGGITIHMNQLWLRGLGYHPASRKILTHTPCVFYTGVVPWEDRMHRPSWPRFPGVPWNSCWQVFHRNYQKPTRKTQNIYPQNSIIWFIPR